MSLRTNGTRLAMVTKELLIRWRETRAYWQDARADEFERKYMDELQSSVDRAVIVIEELDKIISKIRHDCE
jgi:hypothetical protein